MGLVNKALVILSSSYVTLLVILILSSFQLNNIYLIAGFISLFLILFSERVQWIGVFMVYIPALWCLYLLVFLTEPAPFISLAAGYIIALPMVILISGLMSYITGGIVSYLMAMISAIALYNATLNGYNTPEELFIYLVGVITGRAAGQLQTQTQQPYTFALNIVAAISILAFILLMMNSSGSKIYRARVRIHLEDIVILLVSIIVIMLAVQFSALFLASSTISLLLLLACVMVVLTLSSRV